MNWATQQSSDTGNGAIVHVSTCTTWPNVKMYEIRSYSGRDQNKTWYEAVGDEKRLEFATTDAAARRYRECEHLRDQSAEIARLKKMLSAAS